MTGKNPAYLARKKEIEERNERYLRMTPIERILHNCSSIKKELDGAKFGISCGHGRDVCIECSLCEIEKYAKKLENELGDSNKLLSHYVDEGYECTNCMDGDDSCQCEEVRQFLKNRHETPK